MPCPNSGLSSNWVPGAISNGPMSSVVSTPVRLKASESSRRSERVTSGIGKSRCQGWLTAPANGMSKSSSTILYPGPSTAVQTAVTHGWVTRSAKPRNCSGWIST